MEQPNMQRRYRYSHDNGILFLVASQYSGVFFLCFFFLSAGFI